MGYLDVLIGFGVETTETYIEHIIFKDVHRIKDIFARHLTNMGVLFNNIFYFKLWKYMIELLIILSFTVVLYNNKKVNVNKDNKQAYMNELLEKIEKRYEI
jgi:hypothetical protein